MRERYNRLYKDIQKQNESRRRASGFAPELITYLLSLITDFLKGAVFQRLFGLYAAKNLVAVIEQGAPVLAVNLYLIGYCSSHKAFHHNVFILYFCFLLPQAVDKVVLFGYN